MRVFMRIYCAGVYAFTITANIWFGVFNFHKSWIDIFYAISLVSWGRGTMAFLKINNRYIVCWPFRVESFFMPKTAPFITYHQNRILILVYVYENAMLSICSYPCGPHTAKSLSEPKQGNKSDVLFSIMYVHSIRQRRTGFWRAKLARALALRSVNASRQIRPPCRRDVV